MLRPNTVLQARYEIKRLIARGGMGAVYEAKDLRLGNLVALKETLVDDEKLRRAFEREGKILAHLHHPMLPGVSDHFVEHDGQYLVMRYIPGDDLGKVLKQEPKPLPLPQVLAWGDQLLDVLDYLHNQAPPIVHRDIKPQNLKVTERGNIMLLDFGLAKGGQFTQTRSIFAFTLNYAPLEQIQGSETDPRSDLYSLGATLYHLLTGTPPPDALTRATSVLNSQPDPLKAAHLINAQLSPALSKLLLQAMSQSADHRPPSAAVMRQMWHMFLPDRSTGPHHIPPITLSETTPTSSQVQTRVWHKPNPSHPVPATSSSSQLSQLSKVETSAQDKPPTSGVVPVTSSEVKSKGGNEPASSDVVPVTSSEVKSKGGDEQPTFDSVPEKNKLSNRLVLVLLSIVAILLLLLVVTGNWGGSSNPNDSGNANLDGSETIVSEPNLPASTATNSSIAQSPGDGSQDASNGTGGTPSITETPTKEVTLTPTRAVPPTATATRSTATVTPPTATPPTETATPPTATATPPTATVTPSQQIATPTPSRGNISAGEVDPTITAAPPTATTAPPTATTAPPTATTAPPTATTAPPTPTTAPPTPTTAPPTPTTAPPTATTAPPTPTTAPPTPTTAPPTPTTAPPTATTAPPTATTAPPTATTGPPTATTVPPTATTAPPTAPAIVIEPTKTPVPGCRVEAGPSFASTWDRSLIGCALDNQITISAVAEQLFEGGRMFWRKDTDQIYVVYDRSKSDGSVISQGNWQSNPAWVWDGSHPEGVGLTPPAGRVEPVRGFGYVWRNYLGAENGDIGWGLTLETISENLSQVQRFENGLMFKTSQAPIYLLLDNGTFIRR